MRLGAVNLKGSPAGTTINSERRGAADRGLQEFTSCDRLQMVDIAKARETAKNLREWAKQIRRDAVTVPHATAREDSRLLDNAAKQLEEACKELERSKRKGRRSPVDA